MLPKWFPDWKRQEFWVHGIVILGLLGLGCILLSSFLKPKEDRQTVQDEASVTLTEEDYRQQLQTQLQEMLESIAGVGRAEVLVTIGSSAEYHYAQEQERTVSKEQERTSSSYVTVGGSSKEALLESVSRPAVTGVVVACDGGSSSIVKESVYQAVSVACGIPANCICVTMLSQD